MRLASVVFGVFAVAFLVAAFISRAPPDFAAPPVAVIADQTGQPLWAIRLARQAHEIAVDALAVPSPPADKAFHLWFASPHATKSLGVLPLSGRKVIPEIPAVSDQLAGAGTLTVTFEPAVGPGVAAPSGPVVFDAAFPIRTAK